MARTLILASASPRRRELLARLGIAFAVLPSDVPEVPLPDETPAAFAARSARDKALHVGAKHPRALVLAADTVVALDGRIFGKPSSRADGRRMLAALAGRTHTVITAVVLRCPHEALSERLVETSVSFRQLSAQEIEAYLDTGEPFDKAGAYAIQGGAASFVERVAGSRSNVIGLPLAEVADLLQPYLPIDRAAAEALR